MTDDQRILQELKAVADAIRVELHQLNQNIATHSQNLRNDLTQLRTALTSLKFK